jgi:hypothetical protein
MASAAYQREWAKRNPDKVRAYQKKWREKLPKDHWRKVRKESAYFKSEEFLLNRRKRVSRYHKNNPLKRNCRARLQRAIHLGRIIRPDHCTKCGLTGKPEAHHKDYAKPFDVEWLCRNCHSATDRALAHG